MSQTDYLMFREMGYVRSDATALIEWLNANEGNAAYRRIVGLADNIRRGTELRKDFVSRRHEGAKPSFLQRKHLKTFMTAINKELGHYRLVPQFAPLFGPGALWHAMWWPAEAGAQLITPTTAKRRLRVSEALAECDAVLAIITLARENRMERVRRCQECNKKWLYARVPHQVFCGKKCQQEHFRSQPEFKRHRREWMRDYRQLKESGKVK